MFCWAQLSGVQLGGGGWSGVMQLVRSNSMNASTFSCGVIGVLLHSLGNVALPVALFVVTWKLLKSTRPH
jgi:predicted Rossmann-fold nucleotide-binding protein